MACPHYQHIGDSPLECHASVPICRRQAHLKECVECELLLKVVEEYKPGWISGDDATDSTLFIGLDYINLSYPAIIRLLQGTPILNYSYDNDPSYTYAVKYEGLDIVGSFCYLRHLDGIVLSST